MTGIGEFFLTYIIRGLFRGYNPGMKQKFHPRAYKKVSQERESVYFSVVEIRYFEGFTGLSELGHIQTIVENVYNQKTRQIVEAEISERQVNEAEISDSIDIVSLAINVVLSEHGIYKVSSDDDDTSYQADDDNKVKVSMDMRTKKSTKGN